jgi:hypothetical protein
LVASVAYWQATQRWAAGGKPYWAPTTTQPDWALKTATANGRVCLAAAWLNPSGTTKYLGRARQRTKSPAGKPAAVRMTNKVLF